MDAFTVALGHMSHVDDPVGERWLRASARLAKVTGFKDFSLLQAAWFRGEPMAVDRINALSGDNWHFYYKVMLARLEGEIDVNIGQA